MQVEDLFFAPEDLYRLGNYGSPRLTNVRRQKYVDTTEINGIIVLIYKRKLVLLSAKNRLDNTSMSGWVWKFIKGTKMPSGLKLLNDRPGHYSICPVSNMPLYEFIGLISKLALKCHKVFKNEIV